MSFQPSLPFETELPAPSVGLDEAPVRREARLQDELARVCREHPLEEKIFVAPSLAIGHQIVERLARSGTPWVNLRVETVRNLAHAQVGAELAREKLTLLSRAQALALVEQACSEVLGDASYFGALKDRPGLHRALQRTLDELRGTGLGPEDLADEAFSEPTKAAALRAVLSRYERLLSGGGFVDSAEVLRRAADFARAANAARARGPAGPPDGPLYVLPVPTDLSPAERRFFDERTAGRLETLETDPPEDWKASAAGAGLVRAVGEENEVREVFRSIRREGIPFDRVEILHTDRRTYPALVYELASEHRVPCTFAEGISVSFTRPGRAVLQWLEWQRDGYEAETLRRLLASDAVTFRRSAPDEGDFGPLAAARALREAGIGRGRERYLSCLDRRVAELEAPGAPREERETDEGERAARAQRRARAASRARFARSSVALLLALAPDVAAGGVDPRSVARSAREFVARFARLAGELDATAATALDELFREFEALPFLLLPAGEAIERLLDAVRKLHVASDRPRPGRLHVAEYRTGGFSGRPFTFLLGLDDSRHPGAAGEDPVLLDAERQAINRRLDALALSLSGTAADEKATALRACLARLRGRVTLSYSGFALRNLAQPGEQFPAPFLLDAYRQSSGVPDADYRQLREALEPSAGFLPRTGDALDPTEWWLARIASLRTREGEAAPAVRDRHPWLADGLAAETARAGPRFTIFDGFVEPDGTELDPRERRDPISCSRIETLAKCPYSYFLRHVLGVTPADEREQDPSRWLDPMAAGSLLHEVFRRFFQEITDAGEKPSVARHTERLESLAGEEIAAWCRRVAPQSELAFRARRDEILFACRTLLLLEEDHCRDRTPRYFEVPFGLARATEARFPSSPEPVEIPLGDGQSFLLRGSIDRVDEAADGTFQTWDYKTGNVRAVKEGRGVRGGRQIQWALYAIALERLLARAGVSARVSESGYFFPGAKGQGQRLRMALDPAETREVLRTLFDLLREGKFPHTTAFDDCRFCDYQAVCGGVDAATRRARAKLADTDDPTLARFAKLHAEVPIG